MPEASNVPKGWYNCGFQDETPCDIHPNGVFGVNTVPLHGSTYIGLAVRDNETWEAVGQQLASPLIAGQCYDFSLALARSPNYNSRSRLYNISANYNTPVRVKIWGENNPCGDSELLSSSPVIIKTS